MAAEVLDSAADILLGLYKEFNNWNIKRKWTFSILPVNKRAYLNISCLLYKQTKAEISTVSESRKEFTSARVGSKLEEIGDRWSNAALIKQHH